MRPDASFEEITAAAERAGALSFIEELPDGFNTTVGERGIRLSGGQKQRLELARALLCNPAILVLDEPTSALDAETQLLVSDELRRLSETGSTTVIIIAHRFSTIAAADVVVALSDGRIVEQGTHAELEAHGGLYRRLHDLEIEPRSTCS
ncbi:ATP-binding cassette domain-containing protein [Candidatus Saccharibacteria bacterium]|nr:ATP-binding cassette domain-containing protein [Candidatus Saccharibacteria bacterium]